VRACTIKRGFTHTHPAQYLAALVRSDRERLRLQARRHAAEAARLRLEIAGAWPEEAGPDEGGDDGDGDGLRPVFCMAGNPAGGGPAAARLVVMARDPAATLYYTVDGSTPGPDRFDSSGRSPLVVRLDRLVPAAGDDADGGCEAVIGGGGDGGVVRAVAVGPDGRAGPEAAVAVGSELLEGSLGVELDEPDPAAAGGSPVVRWLAPVLPAAESGLICVGDVLVAVDGRSTAGMSPAAAGRLLAGAVGAPAVLTLRRPVPPPARFSVDVFFRPDTWTSPPRAGSGGSGGSGGSDLFEVRLVRARAAAPGGGGTAAAWEWAGALGQALGLGSPLRLLEVPGAGGAAPAAVALPGPPGREGGQEGSFWML
jgi:hypothetical protein